MDWTSKIVDPLGGFEIEYEYQYIMDYSSWISIESTIASVLYMWPYATHGMSQSITFTFEIQINWPDGKCHVMKSMIKKVNKI